MATKNNTGEDLCPNCGADCEAMVDLDPNGYCNDCRPSAVKGKKGFQKGRSGNPTGRPKGSPNNMTQEIREKLKEIFAGNIAGLPADLKAMSPFNRWQILDRLSNKFMPTLTESKDTAEVNGKMLIRLVYGDDEGEADADINDPLPDIEILGDPEYGDDETD